MREPGTTIDRPALDRTGIGVYHWPHEQPPSDSRDKGSMKPVRLEVIAPTFEGLGFCTACELVLSEAGVGEHPAERALAEYQRRLDTLNRDLQEAYDKLV